MPPITMPPETKSPETKSAPARPALDGLPNEVAIMIIKLVSTGNSYFALLATAQAHSAAC